jgi:hypothetical protein
VGAAAGFALLKTGQLIGSNLKEKAVPALGKQEAKAREKAAGGYVAPKQAAAATVIDEKKAAAKAASDSAMKSRSEVSDCVERRRCHLSGVVVRRCVGPRQGTAEARASHDRGYAEGHERVHGGVDGKDVGSRRVREQRAGAEDL